LEWGRLPARVEVAIAERIGRLPRELRGALAVASVEGEAFTAEVVAQVRGIGEAEMVDCLSDELARRHRLVVGQGTRTVDSRRVSAYRFRHILYQRYLYDRLDDAERAYLHRDVATALETLYGEQVEEVAVQLARHFEGAGILEKAVEYLQMAGTRAIRMSAGDEAFAHLSRGLELVGRVGEGSQAARLEVELQLALSAVLVIIKGLGHPAVREACRRARELCEREGLTDQLLPVVRRLAHHHIDRGEMEAAREAAEECLQLARATGDVVFQVEGHIALGTMLAFMGEIALAQEHLEEAIVLYDYEPRQYHPVPFEYGGSDPRVYCACLSATLLWALGYPDQALAKVRHALALAQELAYPFDLTLALYFSAVVYMRRREPREAREKAEEAMALAREHGFAPWLAHATHVRGWALVELGREVEGLAQLRENLARFRAMEAEVWRPFLLGCLARAYGKVGQPNEGLAVLGEALALRRRMGPGYEEAELHRLKGEMLVMIGETEAEAEACFRQAIAVARRQSAKSLELRAVVSLSRLLQSQGRIEEARELLAGIYGWFTEGFETRDLIEAKALLEELSD